MEADDDLFVVADDAEERAGRRLKRLRKDGDGSDVDCTICQEVIQRRALLDGCKHDTFCIPCIQRWGETRTNSCPTCRTKFHVVSDADDPSFVLHVADTEQPAEDDGAPAGEDGGSCEGCGLSTDESNLLLCDGHGCERMWHTWCLTPQLSQVPEGDWLCPRCVEWERRAAAAAEERRNRFRIPQLRQPATSAPARDLSDGELEEIRSEVVTGQPAARPSRRPRPAAARATSDKVVQDLVQQYLGAAYPARSAVRHGPTALARSESYEQRRRGTTSLGLSDSVMESEEDNLLRRAADRRVRPRPAGSARPPLPTVAQLHPPPPPPAWMVAPPVPQVARPAAAAPPAVPPTLEEARAEWRASQAAPRSTTVLRAPPPAIPRPVVASPYFAAPPVAAPPAAAAPVSPPAAAPRVDVPQAASLQAASPPAEDDGDDASSSDDGDDVGNDLRVVRQVVDRVWRSTGLQAAAAVRRAVVRGASVKLLAHYRSSDRLLTGGDLSSDREERIKHLLSRTLKVQLGKG